MRWFVALVTAACLWAAGGTPRDAGQLRDRHASHIGHAQPGTPIAHARKAPSHHRTRVEDPYAFAAASVARTLDVTSAPPPPPLRPHLVAPAAPTPVSRGPPSA
ncbi:MAG: hypothetical protein JO257_17960 [Deltaproteobacteria bacterium]|nr:hypothetical protein [Deltaproteobacteria bacterium]